MILIVEGANNTGKTTLCEFLRKQSQFITIKDSSVNNRRLEFDKFAYVQGGIHTATSLMPLLNPAGRYVFDRFHLTEWVYGKERGYNADYVWDVDKLLANQEVWLLMMVSEMEPLVARCTPAESVMIGERYSRMMDAYDKSHMIKGRYDMKDAIDPVMKFLEL